MPRDGSSVIAIVYFNAERAAAQADRIAQVTAALSHARSPAAVVEATVQEPLHALKADAALMVLFGEDGGAAEIARAVGYRPEEREARESNLLGGKTPAADAIGRGAPVVIESPRSYGAEYPELHRAATPAAFKAIAAVPLLVGSRVVAVVQYEFRQPRAFTTDDREYLFMLGPRAAQALDRTWQHESALRARTDAETLRARAHEELAERETIESALRASEARYRALAARTTRMHDLAAALSEAVTPQAVARAVVEQGRIAVGATAGEVMLLADDDTCFEMLYGDAPDRGERQRRFPAESGFCATQAAESRRPVFVGSFNELQEQFWRSASIAADGGYVSSATLPLLVEGTAIGVLAFNFTVPVNFDAEYQALLVSVAQHCAQALDRARLYDSAQRARAEAENANRLKDEFVSIVSHELRTPLNAMVGWTSMLQNGSLDSTTSARALQSIHDNATRQAKLIEELLDFSKLKSGRMTLDRDEIDLHDLLRGIVESIIPSVAAKGLDLEVPSVPSLRDLRRSTTPRTGVLQPPGERHEVHAARRQGQRRGSRRGSVRRDSRERHRRGDRSGVPAPRLRPLPAGRQPRGQSVRRRRTRSLHRERARRSPRRSHHGRERWTGAWVHLRRQPADRVSGRGGSRRRADVGDVRGVGGSLALRCRRQRGLGSPVAVDLQ